MSGTSWSLDDLLKSRLSSVFIHGCSNISSDKIRSSGSLRSNERIIHRAFDVKQSGTRNWPRDIFANNEACSESLNGYLKVERRKCSLDIWNLSKKKRWFKEHEFSTWMIAYSISMIEMISIIEKCIELIDAHHGRISSIRHLAKHIICITAIIIWHVCQTKRITARDVTNFYTCFAPHSLGEIERKQKQFTNKMKKKKMNTILFAIDRRATLTSVYSIQRHTNTWYKSCVDGEERRRRRWHMWNKFKEAFKDGRCVPQ